MRVAEAGARHRGIPRRHSRAEGGHAELLVASWQLQDWRAHKGGSKTGRRSVDRDRTGSKHHLITDSTGIPLAATLISGNRNDVTQLIPLLQAVPPVRDKRGRPRRRPDVVVGDRGYDHDKYRRLVWGLGVKPLIAPPRHRARIRPGHPTLGREARVRPSALVSPPADPLGDPRRHPSSIPHPRMRTHLLAATACFAERVRELGTVWSCDQGGLFRTRGSCRAGRTLR